MLIDSRALAKEIDATTMTGASGLRAQGVVPAIVEIIATADDAVLSYSRTKAKKPAILDIKYRTVEFADGVTGDEIEREIARLNGS